jgi:hypothetical protein
MEDFEIVEALYQWPRLKQDLSGKIFFELPLKKKERECFSPLWRENASAHYGNLWGILWFLILFRVSLLIPADTSNLEVYDLFAIKHCGPESLH